MLYSRYCVDPSFWAKVQCSHLFSAFLNYTSERSKDSDWSKTACSASAVQQEVLYGRRKLRSLTSDNIQSCRVCVCVCQTLSLRDVPSICPYHLMIADHQFSNLFSISNFDFHSCSTAGGCRAQWRLHPTKLSTCAGSRVWSTVCTCYIKLNCCTSCYHTVFFVTNLSEFASAATAPSSAATALYRNCWELVSSKNPPEVLITR